MPSLCFPDAIQILISSWHPPCTLYGNHVPNKCMRDNFIYKYMHILMHSYINAEIQQNSHTDPKLIGLFIPICLIIIIRNGNILFLKFFSSTCLYRKRRYSQELPDCLIGFFSVSSPGLLPTQSKIEEFFFFWHHWYYCP